MVGMSPRLRMRSQAAEAAYRLQMAVPPRIKTLVVAVDGSGMAERMTEMLLHLPHFADCRVMLVHAVRPQVTSEVARRAWQQGQETLDRAVAALAGIPNLEACLVEGDPKDVLQKVLGAVRDPLLVMGTSQHHRLVAIFENSVSQYLFQMAQYPMLMVRDGLFVKRIQRILVALNGSQTAQSALQLAMQMAVRVPGSQVHLARVQRDTVATIYDPVLEQAVHQLNRRHIGHQVWRAIGDPAAELARLSAESRADLVVMGSPDRRPAFARGIPDLDRLLGSSTSDYLRQHSACPVLLVRVDEG